MALQIEEPTTETRTHNTECNNEIDGRFVVVGLVDRGDQDEEEDHVDRHEHARDHTNDAEQDDQGSRDDPGRLVGAAPIESLVSQRVDSIGLVDRCVLREIERESTCSTGRDRPAKREERRIPR